MQLEIPIHLDGKSAVDPDECNKKAKALYLSTGTKANIRRFRQTRATLSKAEIKYVTCEAPGTAHEFQTWRQCLCGFAQPLFNVRDQPRS
jgi:hypothetical protein